MALGGRPRKKLGPVNDYDSVASREVLGPVIRDIGVREVARRAGIAAPTIVQWLSGERKMSLQTRLELAESIGWVVTPPRAVPKRKNKTRDDDSSTVQ